MNYFAATINYYPVKSLSFSYMQKYIVKKNIGLSCDRIFSFTKKINFKKVKLIEKYSEKRKLNCFR